MLSEGSCDTEDAGNSALNGINYNLAYIQVEHCYFNYNNISQENPHPFNLCFNISLTVGTLYLF